jgi:hypothetical protein
MPLLLTALLILWLAGLTVAWALCRFAARAEHHAVIAAPTAAARARARRPAVAGR